jgi:hypothetical protein
MAKQEKRTDKNESATPTLEEIRVSPMELAEKLSKNTSFTLEADKKLVIYNIDTNDYMSAITAKDQPTRLQVFLSMMNKLSLNVKLEGSITLGEFDVGSHSWALFAGESGSLTMTTKPSPVVKSISEVVSFLDVLSEGKGFPLKANQDLLITGLSSDAMLAYHRLCKDTEDADARDKGQDTMFKAASELLRFKGLNLKIYGLNVAQVNRNIDINAGGILFTAVAKDDGSQPHLILTLLSDTAKDPVK